MATITFKGKPETIYNMDDTVAYVRIKVPELKRAHCDMAEFRKHPKFGGFANSDLFPGMLRRIREDVGEYIKLDKIPNNVTVDSTGFLTKITITC